MPLSTHTCAYADAEAVALVDDLADAGTALVQTAAYVADELIQAFGIAEATPVTRDGSISLAHWTAYNKVRIERWAQTTQVRLVP
ncbi:hypothetical protein [Streptomyces sp. NBC_00236]|nr:hypothetical protein [Streptomyces sp. NBC_00236]